MNNNSKKNKRQRNPTKQGRNKHQQKFSFKQLESKPRAYKISSQSESVSNRRRTVRTQKRRGQTSRNSARELDRTLCAKFMQRVFR